MFNNQCKWHAVRPMRELRQWAVIDAQPILLSHQQRTWEVLRHFDFTAVYVSVTEGWQNFWSVKLSVQCEKTMKAKLRFVWDVVRVFIALWSVFSVQTVLLVHGQEGKFTLLLLRTKYCTDSFCYSEFPNISSIDVSSVHWQFGKKDSPWNRTRKENYAEPECKTCFPFLHVSFSFLYPMWKTFFLFVCFSPVHLVRSVSNAFVHPFLVC